MTDIPYIFSKDKIVQRKKRAISYYTRDGFFHIMLVKDMLDRLAFILNDFRNIALINCPPFIWKEAGGGAFETNKKIQNIDHYTNLPDQCYDNISVIHIHSENFSFPDQQYDLILAPLSLHIINDIPGVFKQIFYALKEDGIFLANIIGENILYNFHKAFIDAELDLTGRAISRIHPAVDVRMIGDLLSRAGFTLPVSDIDQFPVSYDNIMRVFSDLRAMGETSVLSDTAPFLRRDVFANVLEILSNNHLKDGKFYFNIDIITMMGRSPSEKQQKPLKPGSAKMHLGDALKDMSSGEIS